MILARHRVLSVEALCSKQRRIFDSLENGIVHHALATEFTPQSDDDMTICHKCRKEINVPKVVGRKDACPFCGADLRSCLNCRHYDPKLYNQCRESQAERVLDKDRSNFCDCFKFKDSTFLETAKDESTSVRKKLDELFK